MSSIEILKNGIANLDSAKKELTRLTTYLESNGVSESELFECVPESSEVIMYKVWGLRHAVISIEKSSITFDDIDTKAITGLDDFSDALEALDVAETDKVTEEWLKESIDSLLSLLNDYAIAAKALVLDKFSLDKEAIDKIASYDVELKLDESGFKNIFKE